MMKEAMAAYNAAARLDPKSAGVYNHRGNAYRRLGQYHNALLGYKQAFRLGPPQAAESYAGRAFADTLLSKDKGARQDMVRAALGFESIVLEREIEELTKRR